MMRLHTIVGLAALLLAPLASLQAADTTAQKPNILLIVSDDLGYGDLGCYGAAKIKTPNIDRLATEGVRLTDAHATAAVCQPSRYAILSGTYFMRAKRKGQHTLYFHEGQTTLPGLLKNAGYRTACFGKWHLGFGRGEEPDYNNELKPGPLEVGFDYFFGCPRTHNEPPFVFVENHRMVGLDPADPIRIIPANETKEGWGHGVSKGAAAAHAARPVDKIDLIIADKATQFLSQESEAPLFVYLAFLAPHVPIAPAPEFLGKSEAARYGDYVQQLDSCVGKVVDTLKSAGLADNTLLIFTSDNGAVLHGDALAAGHRANGVLLGQKTDGWEGGHRIPFIARWPGRIPAGAVGDRLFSLVDIMATVAGAVQVPMPPDAAPDSLNQLPMLTEPKRAAIRTELLAQGTGGYALRQGDWVYLPKQGSCGMTVQVPPGAPWGQPYSKMGQKTSDIDSEGRIKPDAPPAQLYHLGEDLPQTTNRFNAEPETVKKLGDRLKELVPHPQPKPKAKPGAVTSANATGEPAMKWGDSDRLGRPFAKDPSVVRFGGRYLLYYSMSAYAKEIAPPNAPRGWAIGIAESRDLVNWKKVGEILPEQECEKNGIVNGRIILLDGKLHLFYNTYGNGPKDALCHATSNDGLHFTRNPTNPVWRPTGDWNNGRAIDVDVIEMGDQIYQYYATRDPAGKIQMLHAIAADRKSDFGRAAWKSLIDGPILKPELPWEKLCIEAPSAVKRDGKVYLFYGGGYNNDPQQIGCAVSDDGVRFRRLFVEEPLLPNGNPGTWNSSESGHPGLFLDEDGQNYLFFQANNDRGRTWFLSWVKLGWRGGKPFISKE